MERSTIRIVYTMRRAAESLGLLVYFFFNVMTKLIGSQLIQFDVNWNDIGFKWYEFTWNLRWDWKNTENQCVKSDKDGTLARKSLEICCRHIIFYVYSVMRIGANEICVFSTFDDNFVADTANSYL